MTTPESPAPVNEAELWKRAVEEHIRAMPAAERQALVERVNDDGGTYRPAPNPTRDPAVRRADILASIARKQAKAPAVDSQGKPIPGKLRWGR